MKGVRAFSAGDSYPPAILENVNAEETIEYLAGSWRVRREVFDHRTGETSVFAGIASFVRTERSGETVLRLDETGDVRLGEYCGEAHRQLEYAASSDSTVAINFLDGRHFIDLDLADGESRDVHVCSADRYEIATIATSSDLFEEHWRVFGPEKDYVAVTTLERISST